MKSTILLAVFQILAYIIAWYSAYKFGEFRYKRKQLKRLRDLFDDEIMPVSNEIQKLDDDEAKAERAFDLSQRLEHGMMAIIMDTSFEDLHKRQEESKEEAMKEEVV